MDPNGGGQHALGRPAVLFPAPFLFPSVSIRLPFNYSGHLAKYTHHIHMSPLS